MITGVPLLIVIGLIIAIWLIIEIKRFKHKIFAIFLILLIIFTYVSFTVTLKNQDIDWKTGPGVMKAGKLYLSWLSSIFGNVKQITVHAIQMNWEGNSTSVKNSQ
jgi:uncharacterized membrane protein